MKLRIICAIFFCNCILTCAYSQKKDSLVHPMNKNGFSISTNFIFNYYSGKQITTFDQRNRNLFYNNSSISNGDTAFFWAAMNASISVLVVICWRDNSMCLFILGHACGQ